MISTPLLLLLLLLVVPLLPRLALGLVSLFLLLISFIASNGVSTIDIFEFDKFVEEWFNTLGIRAGRVPLVGAKEGDDGSDEDDEDEDV